MSRLASFSRGHLVSSDWDQPISLEHPKLLPNNIKEKESEHISLAIGEMMPALQAKFSLKCPVLS